MLARRRNLQGEYLRVAVKAIKVVYPEFMRGY